MKYPQVAIAVIFVLTCSMAALSPASARINYNAGPNDAANQPLDCSATSCNVPEGQYPKQVCNGLYGSCSKEPIDYRVPAISCMQYNKCHCFVDCAADDDGYPKWARFSEGAGSLARGIFKAAGGGIAAFNAIIRPLGDDERCQEGGTGKEGDACRLGYPKLLEKDDDVYAWRHELGHHLASTLLSAARDPGNPGDVLKYAGVPSIIGRYIENMAPVLPHEYTQTYDGKPNPIGSTVLAKEVPRNAIDSNYPKESPFGLKPRPRGGIHSYGTGENLPNDAYDRRQSTPQGTIALASDRLYLQTPAYATYDPSDYRPGQERRMAMELAEKTPEEIARLKEDSSWFNQAQAVGPRKSGLGDFKDILKVVRPNTYQFSSFVPTANGVEECHHCGLTRDNAISTPQISFLPDMVDKIPNLEQILTDIGGELIGRQMAKAILSKHGKSAANEPLQRAETLRCLNAMRSKADSDNMLELNAKQLQIKRECPERLLSCLQSQGGYAETSLNYCYKVLNNKASESPPSNQSNPGQQVISEVAKFLFNGNRSANINGLTPLNLGSLGGGDIPQLNDLLMQQLPGLNAIGGLQPNNGQLFGNQGKLGQKLQDFKQLPFVRSVFGAHPFDARAVFNMFPEREHYSCLATEKTCRVSRNETELSFWTPWYRNKDHVPNRPRQTPNYYQDAIRDRQQLPESDRRDSFGPALTPDAVGAPNNSPLRPVGPGTSLNRTSEEMQAWINEPIEESDSPLNFGPRPSHKAIGLPETTPETGPLVGREDGTAYYAFQPDKPVNFRFKSIYTVKDVEDGILPEQFAEYVPLEEASQNDPQVWNKLALVLNMHGGIEFWTDDQVQFAVDTINKQFADSGSNAFITKDLFKHSVVDLAAYPNQPLEEIQQTQRSRNGESDASSVAELFDRLGIDGANAALPASSSPATGLVSASAGGFRGSIGGFRDVYRCAGGRDTKQARVDVMDFRYDRFNGHALMRAVMNRWWRADQDDPMRCTPNHVCAPKPCHPRRGALEHACWTNSCSPKPHMFTAPSSEYPPASVRYDHELENEEECTDCGYAKNINKFCDKVSSPLFKQVGISEYKKCCYYQYDCPFGGREPMTRAYTCRVYGDGRTYGGRTWAYHPDVKFVLNSVWKIMRGGDFQHDVGERFMQDECHNIAAPMRFVNNSLLGNLHTAYEKGLQIPEGSSVMEYFGLRHPALIPDNLGHALNQAPGQPPDYTRVDHNMLFVHNTPGKTPINDALNDLTQTAANDTKTKQHDGLVGNAFAAPFSPSAIGGPSVGCAFGGAGGATGGGAPKGSMDPQMSMVEQMLLQARTLIQYGLNLMPSSRVITANSAESLFYEMCGAQVNLDMEIDGAQKGIIRTVNYPAMARNSYLHPTNPFPAGGGAEAMEELTGGDEVLALGAEAGCTAIVLPKGGGRGQPNGPDSEVGLPAFGVVMEVNEKQGWIRAKFPNSGRFRDACGQTEGAPVIRTIYKPGKHPESIKKIMENTLGLPILSAVLPANAANAPIAYDWDEMRAYRFKK